jgi:hypothetical protein
LPRRPPSLCDHSLSRLGRGVAAQRKGLLRPTRQWELFSYGHGAFILGAAMIFKTLNDYSAFVMENPDHPAHEAVRSRLLKERNKDDARSRAPVTHEARQPRPVAAAAQTELSI